MDFATWLPADFNLPVFPTGNEMTFGGPFFLGDLFLPFDVVIDDSDHGNDDPFDFYGNGPGADDPSDDNNHGFESYIGANHQTDNSSDGNESQQTDEELEAEALDAAQEYVDEAQKAMDEFLDSQTTETTDEQWEEFLNPEPTEMSDEEKAAREYLDTLR